MNRAAMQQALEALEKVKTDADKQPPVYPWDIWRMWVDRAIPALHAALAEPEQEPISLCERVERRLKDVNTAAMKLTHDLVCMDCDNDDRLDRDRVMERIMQWRNEWDKAMHIPPYTAPPQRTPLTDEEIKCATSAERDGLLDHIYEYGTAAEGVLERINKLARAVERAHGITNQN